MAARCLFIDRTVPNPQTLLVALEEGTSVHWLDPDTDGLHQIATTLASDQQLETILIFAHGAPGTIQLGKLSLTEATLGRYAEELAAIGESLTPDGGVQFYACDLGQGQKGEAFVTALEEAIGAPCAAASTLVGHSDLGGNWSLDVGTLSAPTFANPQWQGLLGLTVTSNRSAYPGCSGGEWRNLYAFAALRADGSVVTWGGVGIDIWDEAFNYGGDSSGVASQLNGTIDVTQIFSTWGAFAALRADGSVVTWGDSSFGSDSSGGGSQLNGTIDVTQIFSTQYAFAALRADGSVVTWGHSAYGGDNSGVASHLNGTIDVTQIFSTGSAFAALRADGSVVTWGDSDCGGNSNVVASQLNGTIDVTQIFSNVQSFAALRADGSVVTWGDSSWGGNSSGVASQLNGTTDVTQIFSTDGAFAALRADGSVVTWGRDDLGGESSGVASQLNGTIDVTQIFSTQYAFAALRADGSVVTWGYSSWGGDSSGVASQLNGTTDVTQIFSTDGAFAALRADGSVVTWGDSPWGGDSSGVSDQLTDVVSMANPDTDDVYLANHSPVVAAALSDRTVTEGTAFSFTLPAGSFSDADGNILSYSARQSDGSALPSWLRFNATTRTFSGTAPSGSPNYTLRVTANDGQGGTIYDDFLLTTQSAAVANAITMSVVNSDTHTSEGGDTARYTIRLSNALTSGSLSITLTSLDPSEGRFLVNDQLADKQTVTFDSSHQSVTITVKGIQDYDADGSAPYRILALATNGSPRATSSQGVWTTAINRFNNDGTGHYETLINDPDLAPGGADRDIGIRLNASQTENSVLTGFDGPDRLYGWGGDDRLDGGIGNDTAYGGYGDDELYGGAGNDKLYGQEDVDYLEGGLGNDTLDGGLGGDTMIGGAGNDTYYVDDTDDRITDQGTGTDIDTVIVTQTIRYTLSATVENASLDSGSGNSSLIGNTLNNNLTGNSGNNSLNGGAGNDTLNGGSGHDTLDGGTGNDTYVVDSVNDRLTDSGGIDTVMESLSRYSLTAGFEKLAYTGSGACSLTGNTLDNVLVGGTGNDSLNGGTGNDTLIGGAGRDTLTGGAGADLFRFAFLSEAGDRITDFAVGTDKLQFVRGNFGGLTATSLSQGRLVRNATGTASGTGAQFIFNTRTSVLTYDANGTAAGGATTIATLTNVRTLAASDFLMVAS